MLTVEQLAKLLSDAFEADEWGYIESHLFKGIIDSNYVGGEDFTRDVNGLRDVLARVVDALNNVEVETEVKLVDVSVEPFCNGWAVYVPPHLLGNRLQGWYADEEEAGRVALRYQRQLNERGGS